MPTLVHRTASGDEVFFGRGSFDEWCVFLRRAGREAYAPLDTEYFGFFRDLARGHGAPAVYAAFLAVYLPAARELNPAVGAKLTAAARGFAGQENETEIWLAVIYAGMVAEENKARAVLKKRVKRLGLHQVLFLGLAPEVAANWSRGKKAAEIAAECARLGF
jgi:hypothetical protein